MNISQIEFKFRHPSGITISLPLFKNKQDRDQALSEANMMLSVLLRGKDLQEERDNERTRDLQRQIDNERSRSGDKRKTRWTVARRKAWSKKLSKFYKQKRQERLKK